MKRIISIVVLAASMTACSSTSYTLLEPTRVKVAEFYTVDPQIQWNRRKLQTVEIWTVDGLFLASVRFFDARGHGDPLFVPESGRSLPSFDKDMKASDVQEFVVETLAALGGSRIETRNLRPWNFGVLSGFRFELKSVDPNGLEHEAFAVGAISDDQLYLILYSGTAMYYYPKYRGFAEAIVASIQIAT